MSGSPSGRRSRTQESATDMSETSAKKRRVQTCGMGESINSFMQTIESKNSERCRESALQLAMLEDNKENRRLDESLLVNNSQEEKHSVVELCEKEEECVQRKRGEGEVEEDQIVERLKFVTHENKLMRRELKTLRSSFADLAVALAASQG